PSIVTDSIPFPLAMTTELERWIVSAPIEVPLVASNSRALWVVSASVVSVLIPVLVDGTTVPERWVVTTSTPVPLATRTTGPARPPSITVTPAPRRLLLNESQREASEPPLFTRKELLPAQKA